MAKKNRTARNKAGNKKRARGKPTVKDLDLPTRKAKGVKGGTIGRDDTLGLTASAYIPL